MFLRRGKITSTRICVRVALACGLALGCGLGLVDGSPGADGGMQAQVASSGNGFQSGTSLLSDTIGGTTCISSANAAGSIFSNQQVCPTTLLGASPGASTTVALANQGSATPTAASGAASLCGSQYAVDLSGDPFNDKASGNVNPALPKGGVTPNVSGPTQFSPATTGVAFNGSTGYLQTVTTSNPQTFSIVTYFKTTSSGAIIGFDNVQSDAAAANADRMLWLSATGQLEFGLGAHFTLQSPASYADGAWHLAVITVAPTSATTASVLMYVGGALVAGTTNDETITSSQPAQSYSGYWHVGYAYVDTTWPSPPANDYFTGSLNNVAIFPSALSASQVSTLAGVTNETTFYTTMQGDSPSSYWQLQGIGGSTAFPVGNVTFGVPGPTRLTDSPSAVSFGGSGYLETTNGATVGQTMSFGLWFKTSSDGSLMQFSSSQRATTGMSDRSLWLDSAGNLVFYLKPSSAYELASSGTNYANGNWHYAVVTTAPGTGGNSTVLMYVDGSPVAGSANDETGATNPGTAYSGFYQLGYTEGSQQADPPASNYLTGSMADVGVYNSALTSAQVTALYATTTESASVVRALSDSPGNFYPLQDTGQVPYQGNPPGGNPCAYLALTVAAAGNCLYPAQSGSCPATPTTWLSTTPSFSIPTSLPSLTFTTYESGSVPSALVGLHVVVPWQFLAANGGFSSRLLHLNGSVTL